MQTEHTMCCAKQLDIFLTPMAMDSTGGLVTFFWCRSNDLVGTVYCGRSRPCCYRDLLSGAIGNYPHSLYAVHTRYVGYTFSLRVLEAPREI